MSTSQKTRCKRPSRRKQRRVTSDAAATLARSRARPDPEDHAQIVRGNRVTHVIVPVEEYDRDLFREFIEVHERRFNPESF